MTSASGASITITARDGFELAATRFEPDATTATTTAARRRAVLVAGALGVAQRHYAPICAWLAARGHRVMSFDLRGIGASRPARFARSLRGLEIDMLGWARLDFAAAAAHLADLAGDDIAVVGHSLGAHHPGMTDAQAQSRIGRLVAVAAGSGYWRDWAAPSRRRAPLLVHLAAPLITPLVGWFPGRRLGMIGDLPRGVVLQWSRWCRHPQFAWGAEPEQVLPSLRNARFPIVSFGFDDDESMTETCLRQLLAAHANAPSTAPTMLAPAALGVARVGHLGAFRREMAGSLWPRLAEAIER